MSTDERTAVFISHANPEDNHFALWLGARLAALGYEVWADVLRLRGGHDWSRCLEDALRLRSCKVLVAANPRSIEKQGVRNEIQIASDVSRRIQDANFIIPLRLAHYDAPFLISHLQYVDFQHRWAAGLAELLDTLEYYNVPKTTPETGQWQALQLLHAKEVVPGTERLVSNWVRLERLPHLIRFYNCRTDTNIPHTTHHPGSTPWPSAAHRTGFLTFADFPSVQQIYRPGATTLHGQIQTRDFMLDGWQELGIEPRQAQNILSDLVRQAIETYFETRKLSSYLFAGNRPGWWVTPDVAPVAMIPFRWGELAGRRKVQGESLRRAVSWHYGVSITPRLWPIPHVRFQSRLVFSDESGGALSDPARMHRLRRTFARGWRNARWRDMFLAFLSWLADGSDHIALPVGSPDNVIRLLLPPCTWPSPVTVAGLESQSLHASIDHDAEEDDLSDEDTSLAGLDEYHDDELEEENDVA